MNVLINKISKATIILLVVAFFSSCSWDENNYPTVIDKSTVGTGDQSYSLNAINTYYEDEVLTFKNEGAGFFNIIAAPTETIDEQASIQLNKDDEFITIVKDVNNASNWSIINSQIAERYIISEAGRVYCYITEDWVTDSDDNYGSNLENWNEQAGTGVDPEIEWEHKGTLLEPNTLIDGIFIGGNTNNAQITDIELMIIVKVPDPITRYETGFDADAEVTSTTIYRDMLFTPVNGGVVFTGASNDSRYRYIDLDFLTTEYSQISLYFKPAGASAIRYYRVHYTLFIR